MPREISFVRWETTDEWAAGTCEGVVATEGGIAIASPIGVRDQDGTSYEYAVWTSPWQERRFRVDDLVASWSVVTGPGAGVEISTQARGSDGWAVLGRWAGEPDPGLRTSVNDQPDVDTDVWRPRGADAWRLRLTLFRTPGGLGPTVRMAAAVASAGQAEVVGPAESTPSTSTTLLDVPCFSQILHRDHGGSGWCSPTSVAMVLAHYRALPQLSDDDHPDPWVDLVAREVFDPAYDGAGNWSFNAAYAAGQTGHAFVTRLRDLRDAEAFVAAGIPLVASVSYADGALTGAPVAGTDGHLIVICGFTDTGDVVVNDPAGATNAEVRRTYDRAELEGVWQGGSGGIVYVIHDDDHPLPSGDDPAPW